MPTSTRNTPEQDTDHVFSQPVTDRIEMEDGPGRRLSVSFSPASSWSSTLLSSVFLFWIPLSFGIQGVFTLRIPYYRSAGLVSSVVVAFVVAGVSFYWFWARWLHTATVVVENGAVVLTDTPVFTSGYTTRIPCEALRDVRVQQTHQSNSDPVYALSLVQAPSQSTGPRSDQQNVRVAGSLENKAEADWIADRIREAAEQQAPSA